LSFIEKGTFHCEIFKANHSTIAVFQTHGSQTKTGLFFVFLFKIDKSLSISLSLQITLSSFLSYASRVKSVEKKSRAGVRVFSFKGLLLSKGVDKSSSTFQNKLSVIAQIILSIDSSFFLLSCFS
jgi:hypothetical protein